MPKTKIHWSYRISLQHSKERFEAFGRTKEEAIRNMLKNPIQEVEVLALLINSLVTILQSKENNHETT